MPKSSSSASRAQPASASRPAHLDLRDPLVVDTRELGRRPGAMRRLQRVVPAPANLSNPVIGVRAGSDIELDLRLAAVVEGVLVSGTAAVAVTGECGRCLEPLHAGLDVDVQELYVYPGHEDPDDELPALVEELLDLEPALRDAVVLALPQLPLCKPDCAGLCSECGARIEDAGPEHAHAQPDPRWAVLARFTDLAHDDAAGDASSAHETREN